MKNSRFAEGFADSWARALNRTVGKSLDGLLTKSSLVASADYQTLSEISPPVAEQEVQDRIADLINSERPGLVSRFGSTELRVLLKYKNRHQNSIPERLYKMIANFEAPMWSTWEHRNIRSQSGFFPVSRENIDRFAKLFLESSSEVDILGSWVKGENQFSGILTEAFIAPQPWIEPFFSAQPWTAALEGRDVLVVHPFAKSIEMQYTCAREQIWKNQALLPQFNLQTLKPPQTLVNQQDGFCDWFSALDSVTEKSLTKSFDIALVACGSYGLPLSARLKSQGKKVVHLGGPLQILFGISGRRWAEDPKYAQLMNDHWVNPSDEERPKGFEKVDRGVYW